jgi:hypothetical protein
LLYPTVIQDFQARRAPPPERDAIMAMMQKLCAELKTATTWNKAEERLEIRIDVIPNPLEIICCPT